MVGPTFGALGGLPRMEGCSVRVYKCVASDKAYEGGGGCVGATCDAEDDGGGAYLMGGGGGVGSARCAWGRLSALCQRALWRLTSGTRWCLVHGSKVAKLGRPRVQGRCSV
jgi:hypothetical protein